MTKLYTTMDEVLAKEMESGLTNAVREALGDANFEMFLDIFSYLEGPRLRDKVSHGEVDLKTVSQNLVHHVLHLTALTCSTEQLSGGDMESGYAKALRKASQSYRAHFHPTQLLWEKIQKATAKLHHLGTYRQSSEVVNINWNADEIDTCMRLLGTKWNVKLPRQWSSSLLADMELLRLSVVNTVPKTVFRPRKELTVVTLSRRICDEICITLDQLNRTLVSRTKFFNMRVLRSRQRENFMRLLDRHGKYSVVNTKIIIT
ncbi:hypothetical protein MRX96_045278 [Rhipicephalus microplus]